ncbi:unnamed protein product, partial [Discosporangium mesarthrocarpum]
CHVRVISRYDFGAYQEASDALYGVFLRCAPVVMAVSCDEAFLELPAGVDPMVAMTEIRRQVWVDTGCPASAGASTNMLLARCGFRHIPVHRGGACCSTLAVRIATKRAKPNGQFWLPPERATEHLGPLPVKDLPGVGWKLGKRLNQAGITVCSDLWPLSLSHLQHALGLGEKTGRAIWESCRGIDNRPVQAPTVLMSIGAEVNYGVRFDTDQQVNKFLDELVRELCTRMAAEGVAGKALTLKLMKQKQGVGQPRKYMGHGICEARSKLLNLHRPTGRHGPLWAAALQLLKELKVPPDKIRGIGLQMTRLSVAEGGGEGAG